VSCLTCTRIGEFDASYFSRTDTITLFAVQDVKYRSRRSLEISDVGEFELENLPDDASGSTRSRVEGYRLGSIAGSSRW
jgi:hypothetical protein